MSGAHPVIAPLLAATVVLSGASTASAQQTGPTALPGCALVVEAGSDQWVIQHDPFVDTAAARQFDLAVVNRGDAPCSGVVGLDLRGEPFGLNQAGSAERLAYEVLDERAATDITPRVGRNARRANARPLSLAPGERSMLRFSLVVDTSEIPDAGLYTQTAFVTLNRSDGIPLTEKPVVLGIQIPSAALMGLKGEFQRNDGVATLNLGPLSEGSRSLNTTLYVLSTAGYSVSVSSANQGRLRQGMTEWYVPYTLSLGDTTLNLSAARSLTVQSGRARIDDYPLAVALGSVSGRRAGQYTDTVTFTIAAL